MPLPDALQDLRKEDVIEDLIEIAKAVGLDVTSWEPGEKIYAFLVVFAEWICRIWNKLLVPALRSRFIEYAYDEWLDILGWTAFNRYRFKKTFAGGPLIIENRGPSPVTITVRSIRVKNGDGKTFSNVTTGSGTLAAYSGTGAYPTITLTFKADEAGTGSNTPIGGIAAYPTVPVAAPAAGVYAQSNVGAWLASDREGDDAYKERLGTATAPLSPAGPKAAYLAVARDPRGTYERANIGDVPEDWPETVNINRARPIEFNNSLVHVYLAGSNGPAEGTDTTAGTDVFYANAAIQLFVVPAGVTALVSPAVAKAINYGTITLYVSRESRVTAAEAVATAAANLATYFGTSAMPIGGLSKNPGGQGYVFIDHVRSIAQRGAGVFTVTFSGTNADVPLEKYEVPVPTYSLQAIIV